MREEPVKGWLLPLIVAAVSAAVAWAFGHWGYGVLSALLLGGSLWRWLVPTHYQFTAEGLHLRVLGRQRHYPWRTFRRFELYRDGMFLSPFERSSPLDPFRGVFVRFDNNRDQAAAIVRHFVGCSQRPGSRRDER